MFQFLRPPTRGEFLVLYVYSHINIILFHNFTTRRKEKRRKQAAEWAREIQSICLVSTFWGTAYGLHILIKLMTGTLWNVRKLNIFLSLFRPPGTLRHSFVRPPPGRRRRAGKKAPPDLTMDEGRRKKNERKISSLISGGKNSFYVLTLVEVGTEQSRRRRKAQYIMWNLLQRAVKFY